MLLIVNISTFVSPIYSFFLTGNIIVYTPSQGTKYGKVLWSYYLQKKNADSGGKKIFFPPFRSSQVALFPSFERKCAGSIRQNRTLKRLFSCQEEKIF